MKVLQINVVYGEGSTGSIVKSLHEGFQKRGIESRVIYGAGKNENSLEIMKISGVFYAKLNALLSRITGVMYGGCYLSTRVIIRKIKNFAPDIVILHCLNGHFVNIFKLIKFLNLSAYRTILVLHAEFMYTGSCGHALDCDKWLTGCGRCPQLQSATKAWFWDRTAFSWKKMKNSFSGFNNLNVVSVSPWLFERAKRAPILQFAHHHVILNGIDSGIFRYISSSSVRAIYGLPDKKIVLHVTASFTNRPDDIKGGRYLLELAKRFDGEPIVFVIARNIGSVDVLPSNILDLGRIRDPDILAQLYSTASVTLITSQKETYSMVCAESLCCGTPVVGFRSGAPELISIREYSEFVEFGNIDELEKALRKALNNTEIVKTRVSLEARQTYDVDRMVNEYASLLLPAVK